ncbi:hypothetical protein MPER_10118, partial [Moniliophthora perniciosa FA553]
GDSSGEIEVEFPKAGQFLVKGVLQRPEQISGGHQVGVSGSDTCDFAGRIVQPSIQPSIRLTEPTVLLTVLLTVPTEPTAINNPAASTIPVTIVNTESPLPNDSTSSTIEIPPTDTRSVTFALSATSTTAGTSTGARDGDTSSTVDAGPGTSIPKQSKYGLLRATPAIPLISVTSSASATPSVSATSLTSAVPSDTADSRRHSEARSRLNKKNGIILGII